MAITFRHQAAGVVPPSNESTRKYGQSLVLQQQQQKYAGQQAGYDRLFQWGRDNQQNAFQVNRDKLQNEFQLGRDKTQFDWKQQEAEAARQRGFLEDARKQSSRFILDAIDNGEFDTATARELRQNLVAEAEALGNPRLDATQRAEALQKLRAQRSMLLANRVPQKPKPTREDDLKAFLGPNYDKFKDQPWVPDPKGGFSIADIPQQPAQQPKTAQEYYNDPKNEDKLQKDLDAQMKSMQQEVLAGSRTGEVTEETAWKELQKKYEFRQKALGRNSTAAPATPPAAGQAAPAPSGAFSPLLNAIQGAAAGITGQTPVGVPQAPPAAGQAPSAMLGNEEEYRKAAAANSPAISWEEAYGAGVQAPPTVQPPAAVPPAVGNDVTERNRVAEAFGLPKLVEWGEDAFRSPPPAGVSQEEQVIPATMSQEEEIAHWERLDKEMAKTRPARGLPQAKPQQVKVGGKPLAVTPGTLTPQETAAKAQIMEMPQESRIKALMPYDSELKGQTIDQYVKQYTENPEMKAQYENLKKQGIVTGDFREEILNGLDERLQFNVLNGGGQAPPDAYVGLNVNDITDPKAKAEITKLPRPKSKNDRAAIRSGQLYIDPEGVIRARS